MAVVQFVLQVYSVSFHTGKRTQLVVMVTSIVYTVVPLPSKANPLYQARFPMH